MQPSPQLDAISTNRAVINLLLVVFLALEIGEIGEDESVILQILPFQAKHRGDKIRESQQLCYDGITAADQLQNRLAARVLLSKKIHPLRLESDADVMGRVSPLAVT